MATGRLGTADLSVATDTVLYVVPASTFTVLTVSLCNRSAASVNVRVAVSSSPTPANSEYLEFDTALLAKGVLERTGIVLDAGKYLVVRASAAGISANAYGIETTVA